MTSPEPNSIRHTIVYALSLPMAALVWSLHWPMRHPDIDLALMTRDTASTAIVILILCYALAGYTLALLGVMSWHRRAYWRMHLHPRWSRIMPAAALALFTPSEFVGPFPIFGWLIWANVPAAWLEGRSISADLYPAFAASLLVFGAWYVMSGLLISTVKRSRMLRVCAFFAVWLGLSAFAFLFNYVPFRI